MTKKHAVFALLLLGAAVAAYSFLQKGQGPTTNPRAGLPPPMVDVRPVQAQPMPVRVSAVGTVQSALVVNLRPRVEGEIIAVHFKEGQDVREGDLLFSLDPRPFEAARRQAEANLARDRAQLDRAKTDQARYADLNQSGYASRQKLEQVTSDLGVLQATAKANQAALETAKLSLDYAAIRAPISGRTGQIYGKLGNLARPNDTQAMVSITQLQPITVVFALAEPYLPRLRLALSNGGVDADVTSGSDPGLAAKGSVTFIDSAIDTATATIGVKATFPNQDLRLWPGQYVNITLTLGTEPEALTVPSEAVQTGQTGQFVYVVNDGIANQTPVVVDRQQDGLSVIRSGVKAGDKVVTDGHMRLSNGLKVVEKAAKP